ncbi:hypothetical protein M3Y98_00720100 [Aphelenchoides besseyi]|nr:hypothetical protein M3Y98_00720100 [Aphelenchoides besseyi]KAI6210247.1 hypothetical protein M3Y96_00307800 [Aphelenchoides besseyi]
MRVHDPAPFQSSEFARVIKEKKYSVYTATPFDWYFQQINTSFASPYYELRNAFAVNPVKRVSTDWETLDAANEGDGVLLMQEDQRITFLALNFCDLVYIDSPIEPSVERFMFKRGNPWISAINAAIVAQQVLIERIHQKYVKYQPPSNCTDKQNQKLTPLQLGPYCGLLVIFSIGMFLASICFWVELKKRNLRIIR